MVALISGGKDSLFSILHCHQNGHKVVALANLHPPQKPDADRADDLESYMYQTIGHAVIPHYESALGLPLYREEIIGAAMNQKKSYAPTEGQASEPADETESLVPLLRRVLEAHPEVNAICSGAIMSDYQRTRVESVALRLGLVPLSYLWQWPSLPGQTPSSLLENMATAGQDARIIKVASGGLDDSFLWQNVADTRTISRLSSAARRFGSLDQGAVLGEGGEYETLAIAGPAPIWKRRIVVAPESIKVIPGEAGSYSIRIAAAATDIISTQTVGATVPALALLDDGFQRMMDMALSEPYGELPLIDGSVSATDDKDLQSAAHVTSLGEDTYILHSIEAAGATPADQTAAIMDLAMAQLQERGLRPGDVAYTTIVLRDMADFAAVNNVYGRYFVEPNPPARLTIACGEVLSTGSFLLISMTATQGPRDGLHVQSRSYWAPANIGPYSQAISFPTHHDTALQSVVMISGQIPLVPATMSLWNEKDVPQHESFVREAVLGLQHLTRIGDNTKVRSWSSAIAFLALSEQDSVQHRLATVRHAWQALHKHKQVDPAVEDEEDETFDVWDATYGRSAKPYSLYESENLSTTATASSRAAPPLTAILVDSLPRGAAIEWVGTGCLDANSNTLAEKPVHLREILRIFNARQGRVFTLTPA